MTTRLSERGILSISLQRAVAATIGDFNFRAPRTADFVISLCRRFPLLVAGLGNRYSNRPTLCIADEYDVQDLLRSVLQLHFDDIRPEEWNPSYGGVQSRSDLLLKPERLVIETKMTRKGLGQGALVKELIVDKAQYHRHPDCGTLICFVYNPGCNLPNPTAIERDLSGYDGKLTTSVVVSPRGL
jgi:REase_DpnII-MboI